MDLREFLEGYWKVPPVFGCNSAKNDPNIFKSFMYSNLATGREHALLSEKGTQSSASNFVIFNQRRHWKFLAVERLGSFLNASKMSRTSGVIQYEWLDYQFKNVNKEISLFNASDIEIPSDKTLE